MTTPPTDRDRTTTQDASTGPASMTVSAERLDVRTEWTETGRLRLHRRVVSETRMVEVTVRREELVVDGDDLEVRDGVTIGTVTGGPVADVAESPGEPLIIVLREETPRIQLDVGAYEQVTVHLDRAVHSVEIADVVGHEEVEVDSAPTPGPAAH